MGKFSKTKGKVASKTKDIAKDVVHHRKPSSHKGKEKADGESPGQEGAKERKDKDSVSNYISGTDLNPEWRNDILHGRKKPAPDTKISIQNGPSQVLENGTEKVSNG